MDPEFIQIDDVSEIPRRAESARAPIPFVIQPGGSGFCGMIAGKLFGYVYGDETEGLSEILRRFRAYESANGRTPLVFSLPGTRSPAAWLEMATLTTLAVDSWLVHSTDARALDSIIASGSLKSRRSLLRERIDFLDFGRAELGEPEDYHDLIDFQETNGLGPEIVTASKQAKKFVSATTRYHPGGRIYVRKTDILRHRNYVEFLDHYCVREILPLTEVRCRIVRPSNISPEREWTPAEFTIAANIHLKTLEAKSLSVAEQEPK